MSRMGMKRGDGKNSGVADCDETVEVLYHYLDGELTEHRRLAIRLHLDNCPPCLHMLGFEAELRRVIADRCRDRVPEQLRERIAQAIRGEQAKETGAPVD